jgi:methane/ammonia monooxygenase subunit C
MSLTDTSRTIAALKDHRMLNLKYLKVGLGLLLTTTILLRSYEQLYGWTTGIDAFSPEFEAYWMILLEGSTVVLAASSFFTVGYLWRTRDRNLSAITPAEETHRLLNLIQILVILAIALFLGLSFFMEQTAVWHMTAIRDTDFTPSNIITFYIAFPIFAFMGIVAFFYARTRLPFFAAGYSLAFIVMTVGIFMLIPNVAFNEWGHTAWSMDEGFAGPLHWGFVFFGWMSLGVFGVVLQILENLKGLVGVEALSIVKTGPKA